MKTSCINDIVSKRISKTDERMIIDIKAPGYEKENFKVKCKVNDDKSLVIVIDVKKSTAKEKFGFFKNLDAFKDETPIDKNIFDVSATKADFINGVFRISIPKKTEFITQTLVDFTPSDNTPAVEDEE